ncbi:MAG TPA: 50S ribosomal protein L31 [Chloroflexi bacterium]|nr:50S ribosomal protein L31 [Chloroflexota bacterium]
MKKNIHPTYYPDALVVCSCGNTFRTGSTVKEIRTDLCSNCHPFYTGEQRIVDSAGQVERFMRRLEASVDARGSKGKKRRGRTIIETVGDGDEAES